MYESVAHMFIQGKVVPKWTPEGLLHTTSRGLLHLLTC